ncbi:MAG: hypothetical protein K2Y16_07740 [Burkholderiales bacterium]|nr:hypothetical protein [Burkholderiales bacterium]
MLVWDPTRQTGKWLFVISLTCGLAFLRPAGVSGAEAYPGKPIKLPYDPVKSFTPITTVAAAPQILVAHPSLPARSVRELIQLARSRPGQLIRLSRHRLRRSPFDGAVQDHGRSGYRAYPL